MLKRFQITLIKPGAQQVFLEPSALDLNLTHSINPSFQGQMSSAGHDASKGAQNQDSGQASKGGVLFHPPAPPMMEMVHRSCMSVCIINKDTKSSCVTIARYEM